jgi:hypothetical protein
MCYCICVCLCVSPHIFAVCHFAVCLSNWRWEFHATMALYNTVHCHEIVLEWGTVKGTLVTCLVGYVQYGCLKDPWWYVLWGIYSMGV